MYKQNYQDSDIYGLLGSEPMRDHTDYIKYNNKVMAKDRSGLSDGYSSFIQEIPTGYNRCKPSTVPFIEETLVGHNPQTGPYTKASSRPSVRPSFGSSFKPSIKSSMVYPFRNIFPREPSGKKYIMKEAKISEITGYERERLLLNQRPE